jgi:hypothetical protein
MLKFSILSHMCSYYYLFLNEQDKMYVRALELAKTGVGVFIYSVHGTNQPYVFMTANLAGTENDKEIEAIGEEILNLPHIEQITGEYQRRYKKGMK